MITKQDLLDGIDFALKHLVSVRNTMDGVVLGAQMAGDPNIMRIAVGMDNHIYSAYRYLSDELIRMVNELEVEAPKEE